MLDESGRREKAAHLRNPSIIMHDFFGIVITSINVVITVATI